MPLVISARPCVSCSSAIEHGHAGHHQDHAPRHALRSPSPRRRCAAGSSAVAMMSATMPTFSPKPATATISATMPAAVSQCCVVHRLGRLDLGRVGARRRAAEQLPAAEQQEAAEADERVRERVVGERLPLDAAEADALHHAVRDDAGRRERRQRARQRAVAGHDRHQQRRDAGARRPRPSPAARAARSRAWRPRRSSRRRSRSRRT